MNNITKLFSVMMIFSAANGLAAEIKLESSDFQSESENDPIKRLGESFENSGIDVSISITHLYQVNVHGGLSTSKHSGRHSGRYDAELSADLDELLGLENSRLFVHGWGGWPDTEGIGSDSVGSEWGINALSVGNRSMDIVEFFYEGTFMDESITLNIGKLDFTGIFDTSKYADDECSQFLNASLVDDPAIPFPEQGLGIVAKWDITDSWYLMGGAADAQADSRTSGFDTAFSDEPYYFYALETGKSISLSSSKGDLPGTYRAGLWVDRQDKTGFAAAKTTSEDTGFYISCDQMLIKENEDREDSQGIGGFFRYGWADSEYNSVTNFFSFGVQAAGLIDTRDEDILGIGYSRGFFSDQADNTYIRDYESVMEGYYNFQLSPSFVLSPNLQYVSNAGGEAVSDAFIMGLRMQLIY
ncbi:carbohydrate porin [Sedimentisphaera salicampi]|uniref:carbohydrate porin n=1 Tax=Sedimentisphaera salicampi TaxID=1941349 RepID=UPI000B9B4D63|nr:carbohydrate porin [Sedimentisphaera salicampi]OXU15326.1 Outer membrane protein D1 [Sedimentisphaera salicampi]